MSDKVTIAAALRRVNKLKGLLAEHQIRALSGVSYESTKVPAFRFNDEMSAIAVITAEILDLQSKIAIANATTVVDLDLPISSGTTGTLALAVRLLQEYTGQIAFFKKLVLKSGVEKDRTQDWDDNEGKTITRVEEKIWVTDLSEVDRDNRVKKLQDTFEALNNIVEQMNHTVLI